MCCRSAYVQVGDCCRILGTPLMICLFKSVFQLGCGGQRVWRAWTLLHVCQRSHVMCKVMDSGIFIGDFWWALAVSNQSMKLLNEYSFKDSFIVDAITAKHAVSEGFHVLLWGHTWQLCKVEYLSAYFGAKVVWIMRFQKIVEQFNISGQCSLLSACIRSSP